MTPRRRGFTLVEMLTVIGVIGLLATISLPGLVRARESGRRSLCQSNLRQLAAANSLYADERGHYVAAAPDIFGANLKRWHGVRASASEPFQPQGGPLVPYLTEGKEIRRCPTLQPTTGFESGCGGYGYNDRGVGTEAYELGYNEAGAARGQMPGKIQSPSLTVMFADAAFLKRSGSQYELIEYSFAESYRHLSDSAPPVESSIADPSIHFRHLGEAAVVWCDGHASLESMSVKRSTGIFSRYDLGWFGTADNRLFDPL